MNAFQRHGIDHLSPSNLNMAMGSMSAWCVRYLLNQRFPSGGAAERGKATEVGVAHGLFHPDASDAQCIEVAIESLQRELTIADLAGKDSDRQTLVDQVSAMVPLALAELRPLGAPEPPTDGQHKIDIKCRFAEGDAGTVPVIGYLDFWYPDKPLVIDLKTTLRAPSTWRQSHALQAAIYHAATGAPVKFLYVTPKKTVWLELDPDDARKHLQIARECVSRLNHFLSLSDDPEALTRAAPHDPSSFYWTDAEDLQAFLQ